MSRRVLMIADADGLWTQRYIEHLLLPAGYQVVLFPIWGSQGTYEDFYRQAGVQLYQDTHTLPLIRHIPRLRMWARIWANGRALRRLGPFHVIHNHYLSQRDLALGGLLARWFPEAEWVCSFWGSDLLRATPAQHARMRPWLEKAQGVTIHSALQQQVVAQAYGPAIAAKTHLVYFGQTGFGDIDRLRKTATRAECKARFGIAPEKRVVCVGYNASPAQHQPQILESLGALPASLLGELALVVQLSYGNTDAAYHQAVVQAAEALPCQTVLLTDFLDGEQSACLRLCADAFILAIQTDSFSASLQEYVYAGAQALVADWLQYPQLTELGIETLSFGGYEALPSLLQEALSRPLTEEQRSSRARLKERYSWDAVRQGWLRLYG